MLPVSCHYQPACPGCPRFGRNALDEESVSRLHEVASRFDFEPSRVQQYACEGRGYRHRARLSVRGEAGNTQMGIFEAGSHRLVHIPNCPVHHRAISDFVPKLLEWLNEHRIEPFREETHQGLLRAVQFAVEPESEWLQVVLLLRDDLSQPSPLVERFSGLWRSSKERLSGLFLGALPKVGNSLIAEALVKVGGADMIRDELTGVPSFFPADAFGQANPRLHADAVRAIREHVPPEATVVEYYAGVGTIGLSLLPVVRRIRMNEVGVGSLRGLRAGIEHQGASHAQVLEGRAGEHAMAYGGDDIVIVDPPRKGLDSALLRRLLRDPPRRLIYLSCGLDAFEREATLLAQARLVQLSALSGWTYFPFTRHVETLAVFDAFQASTKRV